MPTLPNYHRFAGRHWETGTIGNALAYQGAVVPHTGKPIDEALIYGISGGAAFGYFTFSYKGFDPQVALLTRNTFDPVETILTRLALGTDIRRTTIPEKAAHNLIEALEEGKPALVWADMYSLPYTGRAPLENLWVMMPILVYGIDGDDALIADRSAVPIRLPLATLNAARARTKDNKYKQMTLELPNVNKIPGAVEAGIRACVALYMEPPPKGAVHNFGLAGLQHWADALTAETGKFAFQKVFPPGRALFNGLYTAAFSILSMEADSGAGRSLYADFLDDAATILERPALKEAAQAFREAVPAWHALLNALLPESIPALFEVRTQLVNRKRAFIERGAAARSGEGLSSAATLEKTLSEAEIAPLPAAQIDGLLAEIRARVLAVREQEEKAVLTLKGALG